MSVSSGLLKKMWYLLFILLFIKFQSCYVGYSSSGSEDALGSDIINRNQGDSLADICTPNCFGKMCGDDGCGGSCGSCGNNAFCKMGKCDCKNDFVNCNDRWDDGCEKRVDTKHLWSQRFGGSNNDYGSSVSVDSSGNVYITGYFNSTTIDFGGGAITNAGLTDIFLGKFDNNGNHLWSKRFGGSSSDVGNSVSVDSSGNVYITGNFESSTIDFGGGELKNAGNADIFLARFDSNRNHLWSKRFGGRSDDGGHSVSVDSLGNVYITGGFRSSTIDFGRGELKNAIAGFADIFLAKFDSNGNHLWSKRFGGSDWDYGSSVSVDSSGNVYITGDFLSSTIDFGGGALTNAGHSDIYLAKFDSNGNHLWSKRFGGSGGDYGQSVSVDSSGNVYGAGYFQGSNIDFGGCPLSSAGRDDIYLIKYAP